MTVRIPASLLEMDDQQVAAAVTLSLIHKTPDGCAPEAPSNLRWVYGFEMLASGPRRD